MKNIIIIGFLLLVYGQTVCQNTQRDSIKRAVAEYRQTVEKMANVFLNRQLSAEERIKAIQPYPFIYEPSQVNAFKRVVQSNEETPAIRATALNKIYQYVDNDSAMLNRVIAWFSNPQTPKPLRDESLELVSALTFSSLAGNLPVYNDMINDPDPRFRSFVVSKLIQTGDARAQQVLIKGLENPESALFDPAHAIGLLAYSPKKEYYPTLYKVFQETKNEAARLAALQLLGPYKAAREKIVAISLNAREKEEFREAALRTLYAGDKDNIANYVSPLLTNKSASERLQSLGIQMVTDVRRTMAYRKSKKAQKADAFDLLVRNIFETNKSRLTTSELAGKANEYLLLVRPIF
jgi:hypothetical protein